ncbi:hypothetical protein KAR91_36150 [Candidatus Pacearchaeota archaeon]|nr:hypothetical protein [Candidatus Pacearchaeota archaeon]
MTDNTNFAVFSGDSTDIDLISGVADIYYDENHNMPVTKTKYPVEDGSSRTDNFVVEPEQLILKGLVSDLEQSDSGLVDIEDGNRSKEAWGRIRALKNSGELVTVVTLLGVYENMMVVNADASVNKDSGLSLFFTISLEETQIAETEIVQLAPAKLSGPAETKGSDINGGQKQSEEPTEENKTLLQEIVGGVSGVFN